MKVWLYYEPEFDNYFTTNNNNDLAATIYQTRCDEYSAYAMAWTCNYTTGLRGFSDDTDKIGSGCCLRDIETDTEGGGYCLLYNSSTGQTYRITEDNFESLTSSTSVDVSSDYLADDGTSAIDGVTGISGFSEFDCASTDVN